MIKEVVERDGAYQLKMIIKYKHFIYQHHHFKENGLVFVRLAKVVR